MSVSAKRVRKFAEMAGPEEKMVRISTCPKYPLKPSLQVILPLALCVNDGNGVTRNLHGISPKHLRSTFAHTCPRELQDPFLGLSMQCLLARDPHLCSPIKHLKSERETTICCRRLLQNFSRNLETVLPSRPRNLP